MYWPAKRGSNSLLLRPLFGSGARSQRHETKSRVSFIGLAVKCPRVMLFSQFSLLPFELKQSVQRPGCFPLSHSPLLWGFKDRFKPHELTLFA